MKISLQIIQDWLKDYKPEAFCQQTEICLSEVRLYNDGVPMQPYILYLGFEQQFFQGEGKRVVCKNQADYLVLQTEDITAVLNSVLDAFSYYARWEDEMSRRILAGCSLSEILDSAEVLLRVPMQVVDGAQVRIGRSLGFSTYLDTDEWKQIMEAPLYPAELLGQFNKQYLYTFESREVFYLPDDYFPTTAWCCHVFLKNERCATLIIPADRHRFTKGELQLIRLITEQIKKWVIANNQSDEAAKNISYFARLLDGFPDAAGKFEIFLKKSGWEENSTKLIYVASVISEHFYMEALLSRLLSDHSAGIYAIPYQEHLVVLLNCDLMDPQMFSDLFYDFLTENHYYASSSLPFYQLVQAEQAYQQALTTLGKSSPVIGSIYSSTDNAMRFITSIVNNFSSMDLIHPLVHEIKDYDSKNHTEYYKTLFCYLKNERNHQITSQELFIHRNTLFKRIRKIEELWPLGYEDAELRFYLLYSFYQDTMTQA